MKNCHNCELLCVCVVELVRADRARSFYVLPKALNNLRKAHRTDPFCVDRNVVSPTGSVPSNKQSIYSYNSSAKKHVYYHRRRRVYSAHARAAVGTWRCALCIR